MLMTATPVDARFVLEVADVPVAELHVSTRGDTYFYEATPFFTEQRASTRIERSLRDGTPEVLALLTVPEKGCRDVVEERTGALEKLCVAKRDATSATGTIDGKSFTAKYVKGRLDGIIVGDAKWRAVTGGSPRGDVNPFERGIEVGDGSLQLVPEVPGARWLPTAPKRVGVGDVGRTRCLVLARRFVSLNQDARVVTGLVIEEGRAFPHAWVVTKDGPVDPSVLPEDAERRYLELPADRAGSLYLALFAGTLRLVAK